MNLKSAVASALLGTLVAGGASAGVIHTIKKNDNPVITFDASVVGPGTTATLPQVGVDVEAETPAGTAGVDNNGGEVNVTAPGGGGQGTVTVSTDKAAVSGGIVLPGLNVAGLGDLLKKVTGADLTVVNDLLKLLPADIHGVLGQVLLNTPAGDMDAIINMLRVVDVNEATQILGVLQTLSPEALGVLGDLGGVMPAAQLQQVAGLLTSVPQNLLGQVEDVLSGLSVGQLDVVGALLVQTPAGEMEAAGQALVDPGLLNGLLGGLLNGLLGSLTEGLLDDVLGLGLADQSLDVLGGLMQTLQPTVVNQLGTVFNALGNDQLAMLNQLLDIVPVENVELVADMVNAVGVTKLPVVSMVFSSVAHSAIVPLADLLAFAPKGVPLKVVGDLFNIIL